MESSEVSPRTEKLQPKGGHVELHVEMAKKINFACHQNDFPFLQDLRVENLQTDVCLENLIVTIESNPAFLKPRSWEFSRIDPETIIPVAAHERNINLDGQFLLDLVEKVKGEVIIQASISGQILAEKIIPDVELLAYNEWGGTDFMPEMLAAFAVPNDHAVDRLVNAASRILRKAGKSDQMDGYKSKSRERVWEMTSALYSSIANLGISYSNPPASYEKNGQKIRLPSQVLENKVGTCLDTTMLFASALEQLGLNPIIALPEGHAMVGVWLQPESLASVVIDDAEVLRKRIQLNEMIFIETTYLTSHPTPTFSKAVDEAKRLLAPEGDAKFHAAIDIQRARAHKISPLALRSANRQEGFEAPVAEVELGLDSAPPLPDFVVEEDEDLSSETPMQRVDRWQRKLLDLTAKNPLLNFKESKASLRIICPEPGLLEDKLAEGQKLSLSALPKRNGQQQDEVLHNIRTGDHITDDYARSALENKQILVSMTEDELNKRAVEIYRKAQTSLQEGGANTLFLALGFLRWKRDERESKAFKAPLILLPVTLERRSVRSGFKLTSHDDEPRFNTTLIEMLRKDFDINISGFDGDLPTDHSGIDVLGIWDRVRRKIKDAKGFEVTEDVALGHFSFAKYLMWKDLVDRSDKLRENSVVRHLMDSPKDTYSSETDFVDGTYLDKDYNPTDLLTPLPADASQMSAIATADKGKDFVIIGPPGTGKSQTISNLIAHMLGKGKTVLFVSEKTAALNVVYRRLENLGLGRFCLALHSNKARKTEVLEQLRESWNPVINNLPSEWKKEADRLKKLRDRLNLIVERLHKPRKNGLTAHYAMGVKVRDEAITSKVKFNWANSEVHDEESLEQLREVVEKLRIQAQAIGDMKNSPFHLVESAEWSPQWESEITAMAGDLATHTIKVRAALNQLLETLKITLPDESLKRLNGLATLAKAMLDAYRGDAGFALTADGNDYIESLELAINHLRRYSDSHALLSCVYDKNAWRNLDGEVLEQDWNIACNQWWPKSLFLKRRIIKKMRLGGAKGKPNPHQDAAVLAQMRVEGLAIDKLSKQLNTLKLWDGLDTDPDKAQELKTLGEKIRTSVGLLTDDVSQLASLRANVRTLITETNDFLAPDAPIGRAAHEFLNSYKSLDALLDAFQIKAGSDVKKIFVESNHILDDIEREAGNIQSRHQELKNWCIWRQRRKEALALGLDSLVFAIDKGDISPDEINDSFEAAYCCWWSAAVIGEDEVLREFSSPEHNATIERFREVDAEFQNITARYIEATLAGDLPGADDVRKNSDWGVLRRELQKKTRHKSVRTLIEEIPEVLTSLAPCMMMSPLSVAQYLPTQQELFDVVIFDEASQITVWDAVGSLARGKQVIIAGDPKQMPPTSFFARKDEDPDGDGEYEPDLESILDEMLGASIPSLTLNLHYRSKRESLIAFSNHHYYNNALITFPAPVHPDRAVSVQYLNGIYARGGARHNEVEAKAVVKEIITRLNSNDPKIQGQSIGVVTFNSEQQSLIENLLDRERAKNPHLERFFDSNQVIEPVFVKNLETVQGDERDVILFSITYGPDRSGHVTMNFGPLNRDGGERRLNVALTRARDEMKVFSSLSHEDINLSATQSVGVRGLKHFLQYAERGPAELGAAIHGTLGDFESPFESAVAIELREKGWEIHPQIGVSAYRIDLGVVHPDMPGVYLAGVECDGAMYHSTAYARERDKIRQSVLEGLGWKLFRIWSTDWWTNKHAAIQSINNDLVALLERDRQERAEAEERKQDSLKKTDDGNEANEANESELVHEEIDHEIEVQEKPEIQPNQSILEDTSSQSSESTSVIEEHKASDIDYDYSVADFSSNDFDVRPRDFFTEPYTNKLADIVKHVIDWEGPIHKVILAERISDLHGFDDVTEQCITRVGFLARKYRDSVMETTGEFFWPRGSDPEIDAPARYRGREGELRKLEYIALAEIKRIINPPVSNFRDFDLDKVVELYDKNGGLDKAALNRLEEARDGS